MRISRKLLLVIPLALWIGGCANIQTAWEVITSASVSPTQILVASNAFDAAEATATQFLIWCKANKAQAYCALNIRKKVVASVRSGRAARNQLEPYVVSNTAGPAAIYNTLVAALNAFQANLPPAGAMATGVTR